MNCLTILLNLLLAAQPAAPATAPADAPASQPTTQVTLHPSIEPGLYWNLMRTEQFGIGIPENWSNLPPRSNMVLFLAKEGIKDETRQPLDVGLSIERLTKPAQSLEAEAEKLVERYKTEKSITIEGEPTTEKVKLSDGSDAILVGLHLTAGGRRTYLQKLLTSTPTNRWVVSGYITGGMDSILPKSDSDMAHKLKAHLMTFTLDPNKLDQQPLTKAYLSPPQQQLPASTTQPSKK
jgi:hypothetical protein